MANQLKRMMSAHYAMLELFLDPAGYSIKEIAKRTNRTPQSVSIIFNSCVMQEQIARRRAEIEKVTNQAQGTNVLNARSILEGGAVDAAKTHVALLKAEDDSVKQRSANAILDRVGLSSRIESDKSHNVVIEANTVNLLAVAMNESLARSDVKEKTLDHVEVVK